MGRSIHHPVGLIHYSPQHSFRGYTLFTTNGGDHATLVDMEGRVCHRWHHEEGLAYGYLLPNGNLLCRLPPPAEIAGMTGLGGASKGLVELDWESNVVWEYSNSLVHHDYKRLPNGNTLALFWEPLTPDMTGRVQGGYVGEEDPKEMLADVVREITPDGSVVDEWRSWEHMDFDNEVICPLEGRKEWSHGNALSVTSDGDLLLSFRQISVVGIVDRSSGDFKWKWGPGDISHQHHTTYLDNDRVLLFDNGSHRRGPDYSRVIEVDPGTNEIAWEYHGSPVATFYSSHISGAERLPNGNTLVCEGSSGRLFEVTYNSEVVWEYINPYFFIDRRFGGLSNATFRCHRYGLDHPSLESRDLDPARHANHNRLYAAG